MYCDWPVEVCLLFIIGINAVSCGVNMQQLYRHFRYRMTSHAMVLSFETAPYRDNVGRTPAKNDLKASLSRR